MLEGLLQFQNRIDFYRCFVYYSIDGNNAFSTFGYEFNDEIRRLLEDFRDMVNFCIEVASKHDITSCYRLRKIIYDEWKSRWDYSTHYCHSACRVATSTLKSFRRLKRKGLAEGDKPAKKLFIQLDPQLVKYEGDRLRISVNHRYTSSLCSFSMLLPPTTYPRKPSMST